ncbi:MAG TPA: HEAT repeat domain-containing protein, partial [Methanomicrobiales archaeon]|nr:HEAT repeat domain-containing protein [Methanomicrobiales archaeon]
MKSRKEKESRGSERAPRAQAAPPAEMRDPKAVDHLIKALSDKDEMVRSQAARALGEMRDPKAVDHLIRALKDRHKLVRAEAAEALGRIGDPL